jgi:two-component system response regulator MprA
LFIVDDDVRSARCLASMLEEDGFVVEVLKDGREALERLEVGPPPDGIITDLIMPRAGGIAVLGAARRRKKDVQVIFVTGHPELLAPPPIGRRGDRAPFESIGLLPEPLVLTKPVSYAQLAEALRPLLERSPRGAKVASNG